MKKQWLVVALVALGGLTSKTFADVQNIRLSGDIRLRGYFLDNAGDDGAGSQEKGGASFISQRTRVSVEADLEDHVLVVVTLRSEGLWGTENETSHSSSGAGSQNSNGSINRGWDVGIDEAYVQFNELFYTPATLKVGRQYLQYGRGLIISSYDQEYNFDAGRLVLDYYPLTIDLVAGQLVNNQTFSSTPTHAGASDLLFVNARYELSDSLVKDVEAYFGWVSQGSSIPVASTAVPPTSPNGSSPLIIGARTDLNLTEGLQSWVEGAFEFGSDGIAGSDGLAAGLVNVGAKYTLKDVQWVPVLNANYTFATGGGSDGDGTFIPWFNYQEGYNGYLFAPNLSNINIFNLGASVKPYENTTLALQVYYYLKADKNSPAGSDPNIDFGGMGSVPSAASQDIGWEIDGILGYDYSKDVRAQLVYGAFIPEEAYRKSGTSAVAEEVRAELNVKF